MPVLVRMTTIPASLKFLLRGQLYYMKQQGYEVTAISSAGDEAADVMKNEECVHVAVPLTRYISPVNDLICLFKLISIFKKIKPSIVHTHTPKAGLIGMWAAYFAGVPVRLHTIAGLPWMERKGFMRWMLKQVEKLTALPALQVYPNSERLRSFMLQQHIAASKLKVLGAGSSNGIDCKYFSRTDAIQEKGAQLKRDNHVAPNAVVWIFAGRIVTDKGMEELLDAFVNVHRHHPEDQLWLLGSEEPQLDPLKEKYKNILLEHPAIRRMGFVEDVRPYFAAADVLVFPSYREGFPNVPMQAGAMGCALILSDINGCNEIVDDKVNGILVPVKSSLHVYEAMKELREDASKRYAYSLAIRKKLEQGFDQQKIWSAIREEYEYWMKKLSVIV